jgi:RNA polymerase sigma-70 factor, ECF subfamily
MSQSFVALSARSGPPVEAYREVSEPSTLRGKYRGVTAPQTCEELLPGATSGDRQALESLVTILLPRVRNLIRYLVRRDADVDDLLQDSLLTVLSGLKSYRGEGAFTAWSDRVVVRYVFRQLRRFKKEPSRSLDSVPFDSDTLVTDEPAPDSYLHRRSLVAALDRLPFDQRHALVLHHVLDMTVPEISEQLSLPVETVRSRLRLAAQKIREQHARKLEAL